MFAERFGAVAGVLAALLLLGTSAAKDGAPGYEDYASGTEYGSYGLPDPEPPSGVVVPPEPAPGPIAGASSQEFSTHRVSMRHRPLRSLMCSEIFI